MTDFFNKCEILGSLYDDYRDHQGYDEFFYFNDLGLPLAYYAKERLVSLTDKAKEYVELTWQDLLEKLDTEDVGFEYSDELLDSWKSILN